jgi:peptide/nickel transport system substrate-binding protein
MKSNKSRWAVWLMALLMVVAACGDDDDSGGTTAATTATTAGATTTAAPTTTEAPAEQVLTIGVPGDIQTLDPCCANFIRSHEALLMMYEVPVIHPSAGSGVAEATQLESRYFESWEAHSDGLTYTIKVREGVTFDDGEPITAETVRFMVERNLNTPGGGAWLLGNIAQVSQPPVVIDTYTLELTTDQFSPLVMQSFYMSSSVAIDPRVVAENATDDDPWAIEFLSRNASNASGPYQLVSRVPDQEVVFEARDDFYLGKPAYDRIVWKVIPSPAERVQLLKAGAIDVAVGLGTEEFVALEGAEGVNVIKASSKNMAYIGMNNSIAPFDNKTVRQAVSYAVDYDDILENVYQGDAGRLWGPLPNGAAFSLGDQIGYTQDTAMATALLDEAGWDGQTVTLSIDSAKAEHQLIAVRVQAALRDVGIDVEIEQLPAAVFAERKVAKELQMFVDESLAWIDDPNYSMSLQLEGGVFGNYADYNNERVNEIIVAGWLEPDQEVRRAMFEEAQRLIVDEAPWVFLAQPDFKIAMRDSVEGFVLYPNEIPRFADLRPAGS